MMDEKQKCFICIRNLFYEIINKPRKINQIAFYSKNLENLSKNIE